MTRTNNAPIGILDSGMGGLSIWREVVSLLPNESIVYLADSARCPYGNRPKEEIKQFAREMVRFLLYKGVKLIVIGCNTITVTCLDTLREEFPDIPLVGTVPVIKTAASLTKGAIGILSTKATAQSSYQKELIAQFAPNRNVLNKGTDLLVPFVEKGEVTGKPLMSVIHQVLAPFKQQNVRAIALGCSHFPFLKKAIQQELGAEVAILDSGAAIARQVERVLKSNDQLHRGEAEYSFYTTGDKSVFANIVKKLLPGQEIDTVGTIQLEDVILL